MKRTKRSYRLIIALTVGCILGFIPGQSLAEYPSKPINFLIPFGVGGSADLMGRALANGTKNYLGQPIVPINRPGAGGGIMYTAFWGFASGICSPVLRS